MSCTRCDSPTIAVAVPEALTGVAPGETVSICTTCLTVEAATAADPEADLDSVSETLPDGGAGVATLLLVDLLESLATNRADVETVVADLEARGVDPLLALERLADDPSVEPAIDLRRRRTQFEQLVL